ncbi:hypothetical protein J2W32_003753 [Variovorax boronicumulans]|uniref:Uncharacterized protein n=1 Tax=Variovorax boronicumulans TaxID=436515 RepID=A0AAW8CXC1_9BURK|nr:hypothetical protein [Variovorax boronicumulans]MDP9894985.1 hypothetical protein [Variovorax boronicumulans]MDQ0038479.1 hypothetical protein [Variovorax boronicumulans]MDQ0044642.1 hypothetical protein [Variovorax boronicumulans]MDQ0054695.1 hypothetical protein [Variovorax boronicumulans]
MAEQDEHNLGQDVRTLGIEHQVLHALIGALFATHPQKDRVLASFREQIDALCHFAPKGTDPEWLAKLRARAAQHEHALRHLDAIE